MQSEFGDHYIMSSFDIRHTDEWGYRLRDGDDEGLCKLSYFEDTEEGEREGNSIIINVGMMPGLIEAMKEKYKQVTGNDIDGG